MNTFISPTNKEKLLIGCTKLLSDKLKINVDKKDLDITITQIINLIKDKYSNDMNIEIKTLNNICLTNVKNYYSNETGDESLLQNKISNLELKRKNILNNYNNNIINSINNNKSFVISSLNNISNNEFDLANIHLQYSDFSFKPNKLILPKYINNIMPYISLNIYINDNILTYNYICSFKNDMWDTWTTSDDYIFKLYDNKIHYSFTDYNNNLINFDLTKFNIKNIKLINNLIFINIDRYINYFENKDYLIIENTKKKYRKKINKIIDYDIIIEDNDDPYFLENLSNSQIILYENQFSLIMNYYTK